MERREEKNIYIRELYASFETQVNILEINEDLRYVAEVQKMLKAKERNKGFKNLETNHVVVGFCAHCLEVLQQESGPCQLQQFNSYINCGFGV